MTKKLTIGYCKDVAIERNGVCLSDKYINNSSLLQWMCHNGCIWEESLASIKNKGNWCRNCVGRKRKYNIDTFKDIAKNKGVECLSLKYNGYNSELKMKCKNNHIWTTNAKNLIFGKSWCRQCNYGKGAADINFARSLALSKGGECLSGKCRGELSVLLWRCAVGHTWSSKLRTVKTSWCPTCHIEKCRYTINDAIKLALKNNGRCVSKEYINSQSKLTWECASGHTWSTTYSSISSGTWCPVCSRKESAAQKKLFNILSDIFSECRILYNYRGFDWLKSDRNRKMEVDIFIINASSRFSLAIEYDGEQHFMPVAFCGDIDKSIAKFKRTKQNDMLKDRLIKANNDIVKYFVRFNYKEQITKDYVIAKLKLYNII